ncbi:MAG TPA: hypothetical protein VI028_01290 [Solirubrobacterales bacterium]
MAKREHRVMVALDDDEVAVLDERRGGIPKAAYLRQMLHGPPQRAEVATRSEALHLLSLSARDGKVMAQVALARELREGGEHDVVDWILNADR